MVEEVKYNEPNGAARRLQQAAASKVKDSWLEREIEKQRIARTNGNPNPPNLAEILAKYKTGQLLDSENLFFLGLSKGYNVRKRSGLIIVGTESDNQDHRKLLEETLGTKGALHPNKTEVWVGLKSPEYDYLTQETGKEIFADSQKLAVLAYGFALGIKDLGRFVSTNVSFLDRLVGNVASRLHLGLGTYEKKTRGDHEVGILHTPDVLNFSNLFRSLERHRAVQNLPLFPVLQTHSGVSLTSSQG